MQITLTAAAVRSFEVAYKWNTRKFEGIGKRPSFDKWIESYINSKSAAAAADYATAQAEASMKSLAVKYAEQENCTIQAAYVALGLKVAPTAAVNEQPNGENVEVPEVGTEVEA